MPEDGEAYRNLMNMLMTFDISDRARLFVIKENNTGQKPAKHRQLGMEDDAGPICEQKHL